MRGGSEDSGGRTFRCLWGKGVEKAGSWRNCKSKVRKKSLWGVKEGEADAEVLKGEK